MRSFLFTSFFIFIHLLANGQCSTVSVSVSSADTSMIQLYNAGFFNIPSGFDNVCDWEITSFTGEIIYEETTSGDANDQSTILFNHSVPITDSMNVTIEITNQTEGIICTITDTLFWEETEVIPGSFIGNWAVLSSNGGIEVTLTNAKTLAQKSQNISLFPSPVETDFSIISTEDIHSVSIFDLNGQLLLTIEISNPLERIDITHLPKGIYFAQFEDKNNKITGIKKVVKM